MLERFKYPPHGHAALIFKDLGLAASMSTLDHHTEDLTAGIERLSVRESKMPAAKTPTMAEANASPFRLHERDVEVLSQSEGFAILREHLAEHYEDGYVKKQRWHLEHLADVPIDSASPTRPARSPPNSTSSPAMSSTPFSSRLSSSSTRPLPSPSPQHKPRQSSSSSSATPAPPAVLLFGCSAFSPRQKSGTGATPRAVPLASPTTPWTPSSAYGCSSPHAC